MTQVDAKRTALISWMAPMAKEPVEHAGVVFYKAGAEAGKVLVKGLESQADLPDVAALARVFEADAVMMAHTHPGRGARLAEPSQGDALVTGVLGALLQRHGVDLLDHLVLSETHWRSLRDAGECPPWQRTPDWRKARPVRRVQ